MSTPNPNEALLSLADRVEQATGPDRELDVLAHEAAGLPFEMEYWSEADTEPQRNLSYVPRYTASLDAAMTLVPKGWCRSVTDEQAGYAIAELWRREVNVCSRAKTWPLALTAAALKALSHGERG